MSGRIKTYHAIWDCELCGYVLQDFNTTNEENVRITLFNYVATGQDQQTIDDLEDLSADELAQLLNVRIERSFFPFNEDQEFISFE